MDNELLIERAKAFAKAVAFQAPWAGIEAYYARDVLQEEFPNRLLPTGAVRDLEGLREGGAKGRQVITTQTVEIVNALSSGQCVVLEGIWTGTLAVGFGELKPGDQLGPLRPGLRVQSWADLAAMQLRLPSTLGD
jgi:hypothetical protein